MGDEVENISYALYEAIKYIIHDNLLNRARTCDGRGLELWRKLHSEWEGGGAAGGGCEGSALPGPRPVPDGRPALGSAPDLGATGS